MVVDYEKLKIYRSLCGCKRDRDQPQFTMDDPEPDVQYPRVDEPEPETVQYPNVDEPTIDEPYDYTKFYKDSIDTNDRNNPFSPDPDLKQIFPFSENGPTPQYMGTPSKPPDATIPPGIVPPPIDDPDPPTPPPPPINPPPTTQCPSLHPDATIPGKMSQADTVRAITAATNAKGFRHDPDGIPWIQRSWWIPWDGTPINPCTSTKEQLMAFIFPKPGGVHTMRGLRERFYEVKPFADNSNPTVSEIENWNIEVIRHFRRLLGFNQTTHPVYNNKCTYLRAAWSEERARTNYWTSKYPGTIESSSGPCSNPYSSNRHCGGGFILNPIDQIPYKCPPTMEDCTASGGAEGIQTINTDIPWAVKMGRIIGTFLNTDGIGAHTGPFIGREYFGSAWFIDGKSTEFRGKWTGKLNPTCP